MKATTTNLPPGERILSAASSAFASSQFIIHKIRAPETACCRIDLASLERTTPSHDVSEFVRCPDRRIFAPRRSRAQRRVRAFPRRASKSRAQVRAHPIYLRHQRHFSAVLQRMSSGPSLRRKIRARPGRSASKKRRRRERYRRPAKIEIARNLIRAARSGLRQAQAVRRIFDERSARGDCADIAVDADDTASAASKIARL